MLACPNKNSNEWKDLVNQIGEKEAFREYMKTGDGNIPKINQATNACGLNMNEKNLEFQAVTVSAVSEIGRAHV